MYAYAGPRTKQAQWKHVGNGGQLHENAVGSNGDAWVGHEAAQHQVELKDPPLGREPGQM